MVVLAGYFQQWLSFWRKKMMNSAAEFSLWPGASHICGIFLNEVGNCMDIENADYTYSV